MALEELLDKSELLIETIRSSIRGEFIPASPSYWPYRFEWFRDASFVVIELERARPQFKQYSDLITDINERIISGLWRALESFYPHIESGNHIDLNNPSHKLLKYHIPARFDETFSMSEDDKEEWNRDSWLKQFDAISLPIASTNIARENVSIPSNKIEKLLPDLAFHMYKFYLTPSANAWEMEQYLIHSYTVSSLYFGLNHAKEMGKYIGIEISYDSKDILNFLVKYFIRDGVLWRAKREFDSYPIREVEASQIYIFTDFNLPLKNIEEKTIGRLERDLIYGIKCPNGLIPIRFKGDTYFGGSRWPLLGLKFAQYYINKGHEIGKQIIEYVSSTIDKNDPKIPEQEELPLECLNPDPAHYLDANNGKPIDHLIWADATFVGSVATLMSKRH